MRQAYEADRLRLATALSAYEAQFGELPGIAAPTARESLVEQLIDSEQRNAHFERLNSRDLDPRSADPREEAFDPVRAAIIHRRAGNLDEAFWMTFFFVHFGLNLRSRWSYSRSVYGRLGSEPGKWWTWDATASDPIGFRYWLETAIPDIRAAAGGGGFSNHRKYQSLGAWSPSGTGATVESYVEWVLSRGTNHAEMVASYTGPTPQATFDALYTGVKNVVGFGRTARFDWTMAVRRLHLADAQPAHSYLSGATGPLRGVCLLFTGQTDQIEPARALQDRLAAMATAVGISADVAEDALCNWQKNPDRYVRFSG